MIVDYHLLTLVDSLLLPWVAYRCTSATICPRCISKTCNKFSFDLSISTLASTMLPTMVMLWNVKGSQE